MAFVHHASIQERFVGSVDAALERCAQLHASDKRAETLGRALAILGAVGGLASLAVIVTIGLEAHHALLGGLAGLVVAAVAFVFGLSMRRRDIEDRKLEIVRHVLTRLSPELARKRPVEMLIDFRGFTVATTQSARFFSAYQHPWLELSLVLLDGTHLRVRAVLHAKHKRKQKNKYQKVKESAYEVLRIQIVPSTGESFRAPGLAVHPPKPTGLALRRAIVRPKGAELVWATTMLRREWRGSAWNLGNEDLLDGPRVLDALISSYKTLALNERSHAA